MMIFFFAIPLHYVICLAIHFAVNNRLSLLYAVGFPTHTKNQAQYQEIEKILYYFACLHLLLYWKVQKLPLVTSATTFHIFHGQEKTFNFINSRGKFNTLLLNLKIPKIVHSFLCSLFFVHKIIPTYSAICLLQQQNLSRQPHWVPWRA